MMQALQWLAANWVKIAAALLVVDGYLIQIFPTNTLFVGVKNAISSVLPKA